MKVAKPVLFGAGLLIVGCWLFLNRTRNSPQDGDTPIQSPAPVIRQWPVTSAASNAASVSAGFSKIKHRASEFTSDERQEFSANFENKYGPAIVNWCTAFAGHVPFQPESVTAEKLVEYIGRNSAYREYIFVVDGITLGVQDRNGVARVDYLNAPQKTKQLAVLPDGSHPPSLDVPITQREVMQILKAESGRQFAEHQIRVTPTGPSGSLGGGAFVQVGGDPENGASWNYDMVFGPDGNLAYYLKGVD
jgi:hypothetical protein